MEELIKNKLPWLKAIVLGLVEEKEDRYIRKPRNLVAEKEKENSSSIKQNFHHDFPSLSHVEEDILSVLYPDKELYGLAIIDTIEKASKGKRKIGPNTLYPTLRRMESTEKGYVNSRWGDERPEELVERGGARRRYYKLTDKGRDALEAMWEYRDSLLGIGSTMTPVVW
jgi:DNA-binding PadR family transcriptional regulator